MPSMEKYATPAAVREQGQIITLLDQQDAITKQLHEEMQTLRAHLGPITGPAPLPPPSNDELDAVQRESSDLADRLREHNESLSILSDQLRDLMQRVEL